MRGQKGNLVESGNGFQEHETFEKFRKMLNAAGEIRILRTGTCHGRLSGLTVGTAPHLPR